MLYLRQCILYTKVGGLSGKRLRLPTQEMQETRVGSPGWEDPLEEEMAIHSSILKYPMGRGAWHDAVHGLTKSTHTCTQY